MIIRYKFSLNSWYSEITEFKRSEFLSFQMFIRINRLWHISVKFRPAANRPFPKSKILFWFSFVVKINAFRSSDIFRKLFTEKSFNGIRGAASELKIGFKWIIHIWMIFRNCFRYENYFSHKNMHFYFLLELNWLNLFMCFHMICMKTKFYLIFDQKLVITWNSNFKISITRHCCTF